MRILIAVHGYPPTHHGGAERRASRTARGLAALGHDVRVLCVATAAARHPDLRWQDEWIDGIFVRRLAFNLNAAPDPFHWSYENPCIAEAFEELFQEWQPDVFHLYSGYLLTASAVQSAANHGIPTIVSLTDYWWLCSRINLIRVDGTRCAGPSLAGCARCHAEQYRRYRLPARVWPRGSERLWSLAAEFPPLGACLGLPAQQQRASCLIETLRRADIVVAPSRYLADLYIDHGIDPQRMRVWRQGVEIDRCLLPEPSEELRIGYLGQMKPHKGVHTLLAAWGRLRGARRRRLVLYGSAEGELAYQGHLQNLIARLPDVEWRGAFRGGEVWAALASLDVLVVPSRWVENSPNSILEAQAVGVPIIGSDLGGIAELVQHGRNGLLFAVDDENDLAYQLQRLLDEPELLNSLRRSAIPIRTCDAEVEQLADCYSELVADRVAMPLAAEV